MVIVKRVRKSQEKAKREGNNLKDDSREDKKRLSKR